VSDSIPASTATGYSLSSSYDTYFSTIDYTGDTDWFSVVLAAGVGYQVWLEGMDGGEGTLGDPYLALYNWGGSFVTYNDDSSGRDPFLYYAPTVGGTYFLSVEEYGNNATGTYRITIESDALANTGSTSTVAVNGSVTGGIGYGVDTADWLRVNLVAGVNYQFDMLGSAGDGGSTLTVDDPWLALRNSSGTLIAADDDSGVGYNARLYYTPSVSGTYFLDAETAVPEYGTYTLVVNASPLAGTLAAGSSVNGSLDFAGDTDLYAVNLTAGTTYNFTLTGGTLPDPHLELLDASGDVLTANDDGSGLDSFLSYTPGSGGTFYLAARESGNNATGTYSLSASIGGNSGDDYAAGTATTGSVAVGNTVTGRIETVGDRDWFAVSLVAGQGYTFRLNAAASNGVSDPYLALYNSAGSFLTYNDDGGGNLNSLLSYSASLTGIYYLEARAYGSQLGGYTLSTSGTALADTTAPTVLSFSPSDEATSVAVGANVTLTFSESIQRGTGTIYLKNAAGTVIESFDVAGSGRLSISGSTLTLDPTASLASATGYRVEFAAGTVRDLAGNHYAGTASYNFTTAASTGSDDYAANSATTGAIALGGSATGHIETVGDRDWFAVNLSAGQTYTFRLNGAASNGLWDPYLTLYNSAGTVVTYNDDGGDGLNSLLSYTVGAGGTYYLEARGYSTQLGDYVLSASGTDVTAPTVSSFSPADEAASVAVGSNVTLTFSEAIQRGTGTIYLKNAAGTTIESFDAATSARVSISGATLTIDATANLAYATGYRVEFGAGTVRDFAGNAYAGTASYNFTTVGATGGDDYAANTATNGALAPGGSATGHIETVGDRDWFAVNLVAGQAYAFRLDGAASNGLWDPYLSLYNSGGSFIASNDDGGSNLNSLLNYTAGANGTYYLEARAYGSRLGDYVLSASGTDVTAPTVLSFSPADEAGSVALGANIVLNFSEAIQRGAGTMHLKNAAGAVIESFDAATSGRIAVSGSTLTLDPTASLASATGYRVEFAAGTVRDLAGNNYAGISSYNFTTVADTTAPTVTSFSPADEATSAAVSANIALNFSEAIQRGTGTISLKNAAGTVIESFNAATSGRVSISGSTLTIDPMADLATATGYRVEFETGTVRDLAGNSYAGTTSYNFATVATGGDDFAASTATTGSVTSGGTVTGHIETAGDRDWFAVDLLAGQTYTFRLSAAASNGLSDPYLSLYNGAGSFLAFDDDGGGNLGSLLVYTAAMSGTYYLEARAYGSRVGDYVLATSAAAATDTTAPTVLSFSPADESTSVAVGANIALAFSEAIQRGTGTIYLKNAAGLVIEAFDAATSARLSVSGSSLTINPTADLSSGTGYRVEFAAGTMRDFAGNAYAGTTGYNFTTGADSTAPTVVSFSPADEAASVAVGSNVALTFSEAVQRGTGTIYLKNAAGAVIESFDAATSSRLSISGSSLTLDPTSDLANATGYRVEFGSGTVRDFAGNAYAGTAAYNFTTVMAAGGDDYAASTLTAASVAVGGGASGHVEAAGDRDWFAVSLTAGQAYTFRLNGAGSNALSDPFLTLYNGASTAVASNDDGDNGYNSLITYTAAATGTYYLEARGYGSQTGEYSVSATAATATGGGGTGTGTSGFSITIHYTAGNSAYRSYFEAAAARWAEVIIGDLPDVSTSAGLVDDLAIDASVVPIDGVSGILGQAGFTALRGSAAGGLPYQGKMEFDQADVANMVANGTFGSVVLHEMGHVLGLSDWMWQSMGLVSSGNIYQYTGANAVLAYDSLTPASPYTVPLETTGGEGTAAAHWSEAVFDKELMTGYAESSPPMPLSVITVGALADLGYVVNYAAADPYVL